MFKKAYQTIKYWCPIPAAVLILAAPAAVGLHAAFWQSTALSDFFNYHISYYIRLVLATLTSPLPFSLFETFLLSLPLIIASVLIFCFSHLSTMRSIVRCFCSLLAFSAAVYLLFVFGWAPTYSGVTLDRHLDLKRQEVSADELYDSAVYMLDRCDELLDEIDFHYGRESVMPYSLDEMNRRLNVAYARAAEDYDFIRPLRANVKYVLLSEPMTYTHLSGVYTFFSGEANINIHFPEYSLPFTAAHEMSHQRGIARENEANFMAFLVCLESGDPYIRYSGFLNMYEYIANALYSADSARYFSLLSSMDRRIYGELVAYSRFFDRYRESKVSEVSESINDTYLKIQGQPAGTKSYGLVVDLAVAYVHACEESKDA